MSVFTVCYIPIQFCCWENWSFSIAVINELLAEVREIVLYSASVQKFDSFS